MGLAGQLRPFAGVVDVKKDSRAGAAAADCDEARVTGWRLRELIVQCCSEVVHPSDARHSTKGAGSSIAGGRQCNAF